MAERQSMTTPEVVAGTLTDEHSDFLREGVAAIATQLMEAEISTEIGAGSGEIAEARATHRNGYRPRRFTPSTHRCEDRLSSDTTPRAARPAPPPRVEQAEQRGRLAARREQAAVEREQAASDRAHRRR